MNIDEIIKYNQKLFSKFNISTFLIDTTKNEIPSTIDLGLRKFIYNTNDYSSILFNKFDEVKDNIIYCFFDEYRCKYIFLKIPNSTTLFFIGPYLTESLSKISILDALEAKNFSKKIINEISSYYYMLPIIEDEYVLFSIVNTLGDFLWKDVDNYNLEYLNYPIPDKSCPIYVSLIPNTDNYFSSYTIEKNYYNEEILFNAVSNGDLHKITSSLAASSDGIEERIIDSLRNRKNYLIILNTLLRKAAEKGGVHPYNIHLTSSNYANKIEKIKTIEQSVHLQSEMIKGYCLLVKNHSTANYSYYVAKTINFININLSSKISLSDIAKSLDINSAYLSSLFSNEYGCTITTYINDKRLEKAISLLINTNKTILEISSECGFNDTHYFMRIFKKKYKVTPTQYRNENKK